MRFKKHKAGRGGWSEWVFPQKRYLFQCCDCNLIHEIEFGTHFKVRRYEQKNITKSNRRTKKG